LTAAGTDLLDGYLARRWKQVTTIGTLLDPIADKLLISAALISLVQVRALPAWMAILIIGREFAVSGLRSIAAAEGYTIKASDLGKTKMFSQVVAISCMLISVSHQPLKQPSLYLMWTVVFFSIGSAISYFGKFWHRVDESIKNRRRRELLTLERKRQRAQIRHRRSMGAAGGSEGGLAAGTIWKPPEVN
jgi:CDP-diacylglycerol--glycerol-3-phosphate 3-phosphatidyltransferase